MEGLVSLRLTAHNAGAAFELWNWTESGADVCDLVGGRDGNGIECAIRVMMMDETVLEMHVLAARAVELLMRHFDAGMIIFVDGSGQELSEA